MMNQLDNILARYDIGQVTQVQSVSGGLMHSTYLVQTELDQFALQRLHPKLATAEIISDYEAVTRHLNSEGALSPLLVRTSDDHPMAVDSDGRWWRLATWIAGDTMSKVSSINQAQEGARALGRFHRVMATFDHEFASQHPLHDTRAHLDGLRAAINISSASEHRESISSEIDQILGRLPQSMLPESLPQRVVHGDPKISNVLYRGDSAVGMIDLDTCNRHTVLVDLGDAIRSWCRDGQEDEKQHFRIDRFEAIIQGYSEEGPSLSPLEIEYLPMAGHLITLELASRFARDVIEDDYFAFDSTKYACRRDHNRARTRAMLFLANDMRSHRGQIEDIINQYLGA